MRIDFENESYRLADYGHVIGDYDPETALQLFREAIILDPNASRPLYFYGNLEMQRGNIPIAVKFLQKNFAMEPRHAPSLEMLLKATIKYHQFKRARTLIDQHGKILHIIYQHSGLYVATMALTRNLGVPTIPPKALKSCSKILLNCCCTLSKEIRDQAVENKVSFKTKRKPLTRKEAKKLLIQLV